MSNYSEYDIERLGYEEKIQSIKERKRSLKMLQDPDIIKKIKKDLEREKRSAKRSERSKLNLYLKEEIHIHENKERGKNEEI